MSSFAIVKSGVIENVIEAESEQGLGFFFPDADLVIEVTEATGVAYIGCEYLSGKFVPPQPFDSWKFNKRSWEWAAPTAYPSDGKNYSWNEGLTSWVEVIIPAEVAE